MGGSFNPIHYGHLFIASECYHTFSLEKVIFIPAYLPPHKKEGNIISTHHRLEMLNLAVKKDERFLVSDLEIKRGGISYTVDTLKSLRNIYGDTAEIYFLAGSDSALEIPTWKEPLKILSLCHFVAYLRPGYPLDRLEKKFRDKIISFSSLPLGISSSEIRKRVREGRPIRYLVPPEVEEYIYQNKLYK